MNKTIITGRLTADPELRYTPTGKAVCDVHIADNKYVGKDKEATEVSFYKVILWEEMAEHVADTLQKGDLVIVTGTLYVREWEAKDGHRGKSVEITGADIGPSLRFVSAEIERVAKSSRPVDDEEVYEEEEVPRRPAAKRPVRSFRPVEDEEVYEEEEVPRSRRATASRSRRVISSSPPEDDEEDIEEAF